MPRNITVTIYKDRLTYSPDKKINRKSKVTFQLATERDSAVVTLDPDCFTKSSITLSRPSKPSEQVEIKSTVPDGTYGFSAPEGSILEAGQFMSQDKGQSKDKGKGKGKGKGEENGPLIGDVEVVPDGSTDEKSYGRRVASVTAAEQGLTAG